MRARQDGQSGGPGEGPPKAVVGEVGPDREVPVLYTVRGLLYAAIAEAADRAIDAVRAAATRLWREHAKKPGTPLPP